MGTNIKNPERFYFDDVSQISAMVGNHSRQMETQICTVIDVGVYRQWISLITNLLSCWAPDPASQINMASLSCQIRNQENLGQTSGEYPIYRQNLGCSSKSKTPNRLGFSRHMKTRLYVSVCFPLEKASCNFSQIWPLPEVLQNNSSFSNPEILSEMVLL